jgi:DNA-binding MarR family transcriptional regulator
MTEDPPTRTEEKTRTEAKRSEDDLARVAWRAMCDLVLDNERRREVSDAVGLSFGRIKAIRRLARRPMALGELASMLGIDPPYATVIVDDLEAKGLVRRRPHPTDRRAKLVEVTRKGEGLARRAEAILSTPPPSLTALSSEDLESLVDIVERSSPARPPADEARSG